MRTEFDWEKEIIQLKQKHLKEKYYLLKEIEYLKQTIDNIQESVCGECAEECFFEPDDYHSFYCKY